MLDLSNHPGPKPKCFFSTATAPNFINAAELPTRKKPFSTVSSQTVAHSLDIVLPSAAAEILQNEQHLADGDGPLLLRYARVHMKLGEVVEGEFFNQYIKTGNILMLSRGRTLIDPVFSLSAGILRLEVDKPIFERLGLEGKVIPSGGRKHVKARYAIELNLRLPSMLKGKKGFERILWAFRNVLNQSVTWLFYDLEGPNDGSGPLSAHQPTVRKVQPALTGLGRCTVLDLPGTLDEDDEEAACEMLEWLTLLFNVSPRVKHDDDMDAYLSRYRVPNHQYLVDEPRDSSSEPQDLVKLHWHGFLPSAFVTKVLLAAMKAAAKKPDSAKTNDKDGDYDDEGSWFALSALAFNGEAYSVYKNGDTVMTWEYMD